MGPSNEEDKLNINSNLKTQLKNLVGLMSLESLHLQRKVLINFQKL